MRRVFVYLALFALFCTLAPKPVAAVTPDQWRWIVAAQEAEEQGNISDAMEYWAKLVASMRTSDLEGCGNFARKWGRALDAQGRYAEAVAAFDVEFECWGQLPGHEEGMKWDRMRAEQIRPEIRAFVSRPADGAPTGRLAKHEPAFGTMLGGTVDQDPAVLNNLSKVSGVYGKPYAMVLVYAPWGEPLPTVSTNAAKAAGAALQVGWQPEYGLDAVQYDAYVKGFIDSLKAYGHPVFLRFGGEMNGDWTQWFDRDPAKYFAKFRLIANAVRQQGATNVAMVWSPNYVGPSDVDTHAYYPGDEYVDWVGINAYHDSYFKPQPDNVMMADLFYQGTRTNPLDKVKEFYGRYAGRKPIMLSETGFGWKDQVRGLDQTAWAADALKRFYGYAPLVYPRLKAIAYFNKDFAWTPSRYMLS
ncbi:MAG TPA: glycosyl hydrolase, partial [Symbiobacteriaceae bacterium]|nr:glycosyl hydrolase [Symbiobacteriaceae bacterium]